jgi:hypothetical protein
MAIQSGSLFAHSVELSQARNTRKRIAMQHFFGIPLKTLGYSPVPEEGLLSVIQW